jgi:hypothetical protein
MLLCVIQLLKPTTTIGCTAQNGSSLAAARSEHHHDRAHKHVRRVMLINIMQLVSPFIFVCSQASDDVNSLIVGAS